MEKTTPDQVCIAPCLIDYVNKLEMIGEEEVGVEMIDNLLDVSLDEEGNVTEAVVVVEMIFL